MFAFMNRIKKYFGVCYDETQYTMHEKYLFAVKKINLGTICHNKAQLLNR